MPPQASPGTRAVHVIFPRPQIMVHIEVDAEGRLIGLIATPPGTVLLRDESPSPPPLLVAPTR